jgi:hypothetical protein
VPARLLDHAHWRSTRIRYLRWLAGMARRASIPQVCPRRSSQVARSASRLVGIDGRPDHRSLAWTDRRQPLAARLPRMDRGSTGSWIRRSPGEGRCRPRRRRRAPSPRPSVLESRYVRRFRKRTIGVTAHPASAAAGDQIAQCLTDPLAPGAPSAGWRPVTLNPSCQVLRALVTEHLHLAQVQVEFASSPVAGTLEVGSASADALPEQHPSMLSSTAALSGVCTRAAAIRAVCLLELAILVGGEWPSAFYHGVSGTLARLPRSRTAASRARRS